MPVPEVDDLQDYNRGLAETLDAHSEKRLHYEKGLSWADLFQADKAHLLPLPKKPFDVVKWASCTTDGYGRITLDGCHRYLASPSLACVSLTVGVRAFTVEIDAPDGTPLRTYRRRSGKLFTSDEDPLALLEPLSMKTRAFTQSSVCALFDEDVRDAFGSMATDELKGQVEVNQGSHKPMAWGSPPRRSPRRCGPPARCAPLMSRCAAPGSARKAPEPRQRVSWAPGSPTTTSSCSGEAMSGWPGCRRRLMLATRG